MPIEIVLKVFFWAFMILCLGALAGLGSVVVYFLWKIRGMD